MDNNLYYLDYNGISYGSNKERWGNKAYSLKSKNLETNEIKEYKDIENKIKSIMEKYRKIFTGDYGIFIIWEMMNL